MLNKLRLVPIVLIFISCNSNKEVLLSIAPIFTNQMVLQQKQNVPFWGISNPNTKISITASWGESSETSADKKGKWILKINTPAAGGPFQIKIKAELKEKINFFSKEIITTFNDVMIGEVWLASGQSNMGMMMEHEGCNDCIDNQKEEIANAKYHEIRMFRITEDLTGEGIKNQKWKIANLENAKEFNAVAYFFARKLYEKLDVPIGIISSAWGGTKIESWTSNKKLKKLSLIKKPLPKNIDIDLLQKERKNYNDSIAKINEKNLGFKTYELPKPYYVWTGQHDIWDIYKDKWANLDLEDIKYKGIQFDDSKWNNWPKFRISQKKSKNPGKFESVFDSNNLLSDGVIWFRTKININDISDDYFLLIEKGIDNIDQTFFNGEMIGNTYSVIDKRNYKIPKEILVKGSNTLSIRVTDLAGGGGFNSPLILKNYSTSRIIPFYKFKFKHHAFITNGSSAIVHNYSLNDLEEKSDQIKANIIQGYEVNSPGAYSILFEKMVAPIIPYKIKGTIWYQGESNVINYNEYQTLFSAMIDDWRNTWGYDFPFYYAQIAPYTYNENEFSQGLREAQRKTLDSTYKTGMAVLMDIGKEDDIHPPNKQDVGKRLALIALDKDYGFDIVSSGPLYKSHKNFKKYIDVDFDHKGSGFISKGKLKDFEIAGSDGVFYKASAKIIKNKVRVYSNKVNNPKHIRYGWKNWVIGSLFNKEGLPASSFNSLK